MHWTRLLGLSLFALLTLPWIARGGEWPQWRGPDRNGIATDEPALVSSWPKDGPVKLWEYPAPGGAKGGLGSVVVTGGKAIFVMSAQHDQPGASGPAVTDTVVCLDALTGEEAWKIERPGQPQEYGTSGTPCVASGRCYFVSSDGWAYCLSLEDGGEVWKTRMRKPSHASFLVADGLAIVPADELIAMDADTGREIWSQPKVKTGYNSPVLWRNDNVAYLICNMDKSLACVELATGEILWTTPGGEFSSASVSGDHMAVLTNDKKVGLSVYELATSKPRLLWSLPFTDRGSSPIIYDGHVYAVGGGYPVGTGKAICVKLDTGKRTWEQDVGPGTEIASPVIADGKLITAVEQTRLFMMSAAPHEAHVLAEADADVIKFSTSPTIANGRLYLRLDSSVACYDLRAPTTANGAE